MNHLLYNAKGKQFDDDGDFELEKDDVKCDMCLGLFDEADLTEIPTPLGAIKYVKKTTCKVCNDCLEMKP